MKKIIYLCLIAISCLFVASCNKTPKEDFSNMTKIERKVMFMYIHQAFMIKIK